MAMARCKFLLHNVMDSLIFDLDETGYIGGIVFDESVSKVENIHLFPLYDVIKIM